MTATPEIPWAKEMAAFDAADLAVPARKHPAVFVGSSTFTKWADLEDTFSAFRAINRGFGGSQTVHVLEHLGCLVLRHRPIAVVYYAGGNDLVEKRPPGEIAANFTTFCARVHAALPAAKIYYLSLKICKFQFHQLAEHLEVNGACRAFVATDPARLRYLEMNDLTCGPNHQPRGELYESDDLHFNAAGYAVLTPLIAGALRADAIDRAGGVC